jgi:UDP-N-acetylmuramoyl-tripeptide--D-alanyl-D-alanine ligase
MKTEKLYELFKKATGVSSDSRIVKRGEIFFSLCGNNFNGNKFAEAALKKGASWAVIDDPQFETEKTILVENCLLELQALATYHRKKMNVKVLAVTGTNGKTTTKELIATVLSKKYKVHYTSGNFNNLIGVPLTMLSAPIQTEIMIIEMGANRKGEIKSLCQIAIPDFGIITNIGTAHIEGFGSIDGIIKAKSELYEYLHEVSGQAFYNEENSILSDLISKILNKAIPYSNPAGSELVIHLMPSELTLNLTAIYDFIDYKIFSSFFGNYNIENIKAAIAIGLFFGINIEEIVKAIESYKPLNNRSQIDEKKNNTLICDSYNANPTSMLNALDSFHEIKSEKKLIILGDMLELGWKSEEEHLLLINKLKSLNIKNAILVGPEFQKVSPMPEYKTFPDVNMLIKYLDENPVKGHTILVKGSRGIGLEKTYDKL